MDIGIRPFPTLDDGEALDAKAAGSKAAVLARLRMAGFAVPDGLVLHAGRSSEEGAVAAFAQAVADRWSGPLAIRSSAPWEDLATSARAGETVTVLHVEGVGGVVEAIARCRDGATVSSRGVAPAILAQPMLAPSHAGVAFTADPGTGDRTVVRIAAVEGVAEPLVSGLVVGIDVSVRDRRVVGDPGSLPMAHALAVAKVAREIELLLGGPQDVEWAIVNGAVQVLQARPITVLPVRPDLPSGGGWQKDVAHYSEPLTPFGFAELQASAEVVAEVFEQAGFLINGLEERFVGGEIYGRVMPAVGSADPGPLPPPPAKVLGLIARLAPPLRARTAAARRVLEEGQGERWMAEWDRDRPRYVQRLQAMLDQDLAAEEDEALLAHHQRGRALGLDGTRIHFKVIVPFVIALHHLHQQVKHLPSWDEAATAELLAGASPATNASEVELALLRSGITATSGAAEALRGDPRHPVDALTSVAPVLGESLRRWIRTHGWRARNYDAGAPVIAERPTVITRLLLADPSAPDLGAATLAAGRARALLAPADRAGFDAALEQARRCYPLREDTVILAGDMPLGLLRRWLLEVGRRLVDRSLLPSVEDAAYLTAEELTAALRGLASADDLTEVVVRRRGEEAWVRANPGPITLGRQSPPPDVSALPDPLRRVNEAVLWFVGLEYPGAVDLASQDADVLLQGIAASPGAAEGVVRIVRDHNDLDLLMEGEVLVCQTTSPAWAPMFPLACAIVADGGGALSHAAIAAREHGLPAVLGTSMATTTLSTGQRVRVDGTTGVVLALP